MNSSFRKCLIGDLKVCKIFIKDDVGILPLIKHTLWSLTFLPGFACVFCFRINCLLRKVNLLARIVGILRFYTFYNDISFLAEIGPGLRIVHVIDIVIGAEARIGKNCTILNGVTLGSKGGDHGPEMPVVGDNVYIGSGSKIIGNIKIGDNVIIGALTFCDKSIPDNSVAYGNPLVIKKYKKSF